jgi:hypothetical protein
MHIAVVARTYILYNLTPIICHRCEVPALRVAAQLDIGYRELTET